MAQHARDAAVSVSAAAAGLGITQVLVAHVYDVSLEALLVATRRDRRAARARQMAMYLAHVVFEMTLAAVARGFGRDRKTASHACRHIEALRGDPELDRLVAWLEALVRQAASQTGTAPCPPPRLARPSWRARPAASSASSCCRRPASRRPRPATASSSAPAPGRRRSRSRPKPSAPSRPAAGSCPSGASPWPGASVRPARAGTCASRPETAPFAAQHQIRAETTLSETVLAAKQRVRAAMEAAGPGLADIRFAVCCHLTRLEQIERDEGWPRRAGKVVLAIALDRLALHYGLRLRGRARAATRAWSAEAAE